MIVTPLALSPAYAERPKIVIEVRAAVESGQYSAAEDALSAAKAKDGVTPAYLEAFSWLGRAKLAEKQYDAAERYAAETGRQALLLLKTRKLDAEKSLPIALGASIEVQAQVLKARGQRAEAVAFLRRELATWRTTSIRTRIQKNLNVMTLEGRRAPALLTQEHLGPVAPPPPAALKGKVTLLFFWAHWCVDCKTQIPVLARLSKEFAGRGLVVIGPTQPYGYTAAEEDVPRAQELRYIEEIRAKYYARIAGMSVPVSEENFRAWGASTTPTLVLIDRAGLVRMYNPGDMTEAELRPKLESLLRR